MWEIQHGHCMPPTINYHTSYISYSCHGVSKIGLFLLLVVLYTLDFFQISTPCLQIWFRSVSYSFMNWWTSKRSTPPPPLLLPFPPHTLTHTLGSVWRHSGEISLIWSTHIHSFLSGNTHTQLLFKYSVFKSQPITRKTALKSRKNSLFQTEE